MKTFKIFKPLTVLIPLALFGCNQATPPAGKTRVPCNSGGKTPFTVTMAVENDGSGNPVVSFTNYDLKVGLDGKPVNPLIFVCVGGQATFENVPMKDRVYFPINPGDIFTPSRTPSPNVNQIYIIHNKNDVKGEVFRYSITVNTKDFGEMTIDPRVEPGGGGTIN